MANILIATNPFAGHMNPMLPIARRLVERGHRVLWYSGRAAAGKILAVGAEVAQMTAEPEPGSRPAPARSRLGRLLGFQSAAVNYRHFIDPIPGQVRDLEAILDGYSADVLLAETSVMASGIVGERRGLPWATLNISVLGIDGREVPPFRSALQPGYSRVGRLRVAATYWLTDHVVARQANAYYQAMAAAHGWPRSAYRPQPSPYLYLQPAAPGFEYPRSDLPPQVHFIGPLPLEGGREAALPGWWPEVQASGKPIVLVTQGTVATDAGQLVAPALAGLDGEDVAVVATTGGATAQELGWRLPANAHVEPFLPFDALLPHVAVFVTNGGYGGVSQAVAHGVPIVVAGASQEKPEVANRVAFAGIGINLRTGAPTPEQVCTAVHEILTNLTYRRRARELQAQCAAHDAPGEAAALVEQLAETLRAVVRAEAPAERAACELRVAAARG